MQVNTPINIVVLPLSTVHKSINLKTMYNKRIGTVTPFLRLKYVVKSGQNVPCVLIISLTPFLGTNLGFEFSGDSGGTGTFHKKMIICT